MPSAVRVLSICMRWLVLLVLEEEDDCGGGTGWRVVLIGGRLLSDKWGEGGREG